MAEPRRRGQQLMLVAGMLVAVALIALSALLGAGGSGAAPAPRLDANAVRMPADKNPTPTSALSISATTHNPKVGSAWTAVVKAPRGNVSMDVLFAGRVMGHVANGTISHGRWTRVVHWPEAAAGYPLVVQATVTSQGKSRKVLYPIRVQK